MAPLQRPAGSGLDIAALVLGILSLLFAIFNICDLPFAIVGIVLGLVARRSPVRRNLATIGLALSVVGLAVTLIILAAALVFGNYQPPAGG